FVVDRLEHGTRQHKLNALSLSHQMLGWGQQRTPGKEDPLLNSILQASHDADADVRLAASHVITEYAWDAQYPDGMRALRRHIEMLRDPSPMVREEAVIQASQYACPDVLVLLKRMAADKRESSRMRETA